MMARKWRAVELRDEVSAEPHWELREKGLVFSLLAL